MAIRQKVLMYPTLKIQLQKKDTNAVEFTKKMSGMQVQIVEPVRDVKTKFDKGDKPKTFAIVENQADKKRYSVFVNATSTNNLIDAFGEDDTKWLNKSCTLELEDAPKPYDEKQMIVIKPVK